MHTTSALAVALCVALGGCSSSKRKQESVETATQRAPRPKLVRAEPLSPGARSMLRDRMTEHGDDMESLLWSVLMLDHETTASIAERIAQSPRIARPSDNTTPSSAGLPARFFELQDELYAGATALESAARSGDDAAIARQYTRISNACISCHSVYLKLPPVPEQ